MTTRTPNRLLPLFSFLLALCQLSSHATAGDWPHWLGPNDNNVVAAEPSFDPDLNNWKTAWRSDIGLGYSSVIIANERAYTMGHDGDANETIHCIDANTGVPIWTYSYEGDLIPKMHPGGPNASVTISGDRLYALSKDGQAICLNANSGSEIWKTRLTDIMGIDMPRWGFASSPVEYGDQILLSAGKVTALDKNTGKPIWTTQQARRPGYGTPVVFRSGSQDFIAAFDSEGLSVLSASNGEEIARHSIKAKFDLTAATPIVTDDGRSIFLSINTKSEALSFDGKKLSTKWSVRELQNYVSGNPLVNGILYGIDGHVKTVKSELYAIDFETGETRWTEPKFGYASLIAIDETLLILTEDGELVTASATSDGYQEISRIKLLERLCWTHPVYANHRIYIRNEHGTLICLERS